MRGAERRSRTPAQAACSDTELSLAQQSQAVAALQRQLGAQLIETHISFVLLAGERAYKIKKALRLDFLDFGSLARREFYCREELRLNRRSAPQLYLEVLPLTGTAASPRLGGEGSAVDWVLCMRAFAQDGLWDRLAAHGNLRAQQVDDVVEALYALHRDAAVAAPADPCGQAAQVRAPLLDSLAMLWGHCLAAREHAALEALSRWEERAFAALQALFDERARSGRVRECHGDLHLGNVTQFEGKPVLFDCLEFSAALRWTDVISDLAFLSMDLHAHGLPGLAHRFVNAYVERADDHEGLQVLRYYQVHRALVRAKVAALRDAQLAGRGAAQATQQRTLKHYLDVALGCTARPAPVLMLTHGFSGSGKTALTQGLVERSGAIRVRADVERKRLFGMEPLARSDAAQKATLYGAAATAATQSRLRELAALVLRGGYSVIVDATFLALAQRQAMRAVAERLGVPWLILDFRAAVRVLRARVCTRVACGDDASEADLAVLDDQLANAQPLQDEELASTYVVAAAAVPDSTGGDLWAPLLRRIAGCVE